MKRGVALFRMKRYGDLSLLTHGSGWVGSSNNKLCEITTHHDQAGLLSPCTDARNHLWAKAVTQWPFRTRLLQLSSEPDTLVGVKKKYIKQRRISDPTLEEYTEVQKEYGTQEMSRRELAVEQ